MGWHDRALLRPSGLSLLCGLVGVLAGPARAQPGVDPCTERFRAETQRIERQFAAERPVKGAGASEVEFSRRLHAALAQAADQAEACTAAAAKARRAPVDAGAVSACHTRAVQALDAIERRHAGRALTRAEQGARRAEEERIVEDRAACLRGALKR